MDYNYVRMRNAAKAGDKGLADYYRKLYESGMSGRAEPHALNYILALLAVTAAALGVYIAYLNAVYPAL